MFLKNLRGETMNFDTPPQALRGLGEQPAVQQMYQRKLKEIMQTERIKK